MVDAVIDTLAATGQPFTADDVNALTGDSPTGSRGAAGARFAYAARRGVIQRVGYVPSKRPSVHAHPVSLWMGVCRGCTGGPTGEDIDVNPECPMHGEAAA